MENWEIVQRNKREAKNVMDYILCFACGAAFGLFVAALMLAASGD